MEVHKGSALSTFLFFLLLMPSDRVILNVRCRSFSLDELSNRIT